MANKRGYILVATALSSTVLLSFVGLATDVGYLQWQKMHAQMATDAAAQGAGLALLDGLSSTSIVAAGQNDASLNGFTQGASNTTVTVDYPPADGPNMGNTSAVEVILQRTVPTFFMSLIGSPSASLTARAVTVLGSNGSAGCVFAMDSLASNAVNISGGITNYFPCGVEIASSSSTALNISGGSILNMENNASVGVVGGWSISGGAKIVNYSTGASENPQTISAPADPLAYVSAPSTSGLTVRSMTRVSYTSTSEPSGGAMQPGIYCGGFSASGSANFTMASGVYYIAGGGFSISGGATISGTGVTIYSTSGANSGVAGCSSAFQAFSVSGGTSFNVSAPTTGSLAGIVIFQDRTITSSSASTFSGGATAGLNGAIYLLHSPLSYSGNSASGYQILVADTISISGSSAIISNNYSTLPNGSPIRNTAVLEE